MSLSATADQDAQDRLLHWRDFSNRSEFPFTPVPTGHSGNDEPFAETGDKGRVQTFVFDRTKEARSVDVA